MLYSHMRFFIAGVEMPVSGPIYATGGGLTANLVYVLDSYDDELKKQLRGASPLARSRFENVPVLLAGSKPKTTIDEVETMMQSTHADESNYVVLFCGSASMQIAYNPDTCRLDLAISAVPGTVAALNNIVYNNLTVGSSIGSVESAADTTVQKAAQEAEGSKTIVSGAGTPNTLNSTMFIKKVVTGKNTQEIERPTDIIEYAISNILRYSGSATVRSRGDRPLYAESSSDRFINIDDNSLNTDDITVAGDALPEYVEKVWGQSLAPTDPEHGETVDYYSSDRFNYLLPDYILRKAVGVGMYNASISRPKPDKWEDTSSLGKLTCTAQERTKLFIESNQLWVGPSWPFQYFFKASGKGITADSPAPEIIKKVFSETGAEIKNEGGALASIFDLFINATAWADEDGTRDGQYTEYLAKNGVRNDYIPQFWRVYSPEFAALVNGYVQSYLTVLGLGAVKLKNNEDDAAVNILDLLYQGADDEEVFTGLRSRVEHVVSENAKSFYKSLITELYSSITTIFDNTWSSGLFVRGYGRAQGNANEKTLTRYFSSLQPSGPEWIRDLVHGRIYITDVDLIKTKLLPKHTRGDGSLSVEYYDKDLSYAWSEVVHKAVMLGIKYGVKVLEEVKRSYPNVVVGYSFLKDFKKGSLNHKDLNFIPTINALLLKTAEVLEKLEPDKYYDPIPGDPSLFDTKAAKNILDYSVQNKVGTVGYMRIDKNSNGEGVVYPNLKLTALTEFHQLISNTSLTPGNGSVTLYSLLSQLYQTLRLGLFLPLNKPYAVQKDKQVAGASDLVDNTKSVLEMMILPLTETSAVPKCNVFCVDKSRLVHEIYDKSKNVTNILIRYLPPVSTLTGADTAGALPASYFRFDLQEPEKVYEVKDPKAIFADNKHYDQNGEEVGSYYVGYKAGHIYDLYNTATIDVSEEAAALAKLCCLPNNDVKSDEKTADAVLSSTPQSLRFGNSEINTILTDYENRGIKLKDKLTISVLIGEKERKHSGFSFAGFRTGSACTFKPYSNRAEADLYKNSLRSDDFTAIYQAACYQLAMHYVAIHLVEIRQMLGKAVFAKDLEEYINNKLPTEFSPKNGSALHEEFKSALAQFAKFYLFDKFPDVDATGKMPRMEYDDGQWNFRIRDYFFDNYEVYPQNHMAKFAGMLVDPSYKLAAEEFLDSNLWKNAMTDLSESVTEYSLASKVNHAMLWVLGEATWLPLKKIHYTEDDFKDIFKQQDYFKQNLESAYLCSGSGDQQKKANDFAAAMVDGILDVYFPEVPDERSVNRFKDILTPVRQNILYGIYRTAVQFYCCDFAIKKCLEKNYTVQTPPQPEYPIPVLDNIVQIGYDYNIKTGIEASLNRISATEALGLVESQGKSLDNTIFDDKGSSSNVVLSGLTIKDENDLKQVMNKDYFRIINAGAKQLAATTEYLWDDKWYETKKADSPYWSYLVNGSAFISVVPPKQEVELNKAKQFHTLVTPYFFIKKASTDNQDELPSFPHLYFDYQDDKEVEQINKANDFYLRYFDDTGRDERFSAMDKYSKKDYEGKERYVLLPMSGPSKPDVDRASQYMPGVYTKTRAAVKTLLASSAVLSPVNLFVDNGTTETVPLWPFIVYYDCGRKASIIYYDMYNGGSINPMSMETLIQGDSFGQKYYFFNLKEDAPDWISDSKDLAALYNYIVKQKNPFEINDKAFKEAAKDPTVYIIYPFKMEPGLDYLRMMFNIPVDLLGHYLKTRVNTYTDSLRVMDPRREVSLTIEDRMKKIKDAAKGVVLKDNTYRTPEEISTAGLYTGTALKQATDKAFQLLFGSMSDSAALVPANGGYDVTSGCKASKQGNFAVAAPGTASEVLKSDAYAIRRDSGSDCTAFHIHGGVDIGIAAPYSSTHPDVVDNWVDNDYTPKQILAPFDSLVVYAAAMGENGCMSGYGFYAVVIPANKDDSTNVSGFESDEGKIPVILIGHLTPSTTIMLPQLEAIVREDKRTPEFKWKTVSEIQEKNYAALYNLNKTCSARGASNYYFNKDIFYSCVEKTPSLKSERDRYMAALRTVFHQDTGSLSQRAFFVPAGRAIGCIGNSGASQGLHYHCNYFMIDKKRTEVVNFYNKQVRDLVVWARGSLSKSKTSSGTHFNVSVETAQNWNVMSAARNEVIQNLQNRLGLQNIHEALGTDGVFEQLWEEASLGMATGFGDVNLVLSKSLYEVPDHILVSVVESRAYQEAVQRLCTVTTEPVNLPYYDPYVMDAGMPAAVVYKNDIVLTRCVGTSVVATSTGAQTSINFSSGISVTKLIPLYLKSVKFLLDRNTGSRERKNILRKCVVYPYHSLDFYNKFAGNIAVMDKWYEDMFGKSNFIFDWRKCVLINVVGTFITVFDIVEGAASQLLSEAAKYSYSVEQGTMKINIEQAMLLSKKDPNEVMPKFEDQLMLEDRAWNDDNMYTLALANDPKYAVNLKCNVPASAYSNGSFGNSYEKAAVEAMELTPMSLTVTSLPGMFYDWTSIFKTLRKSIHTSRPNVTK